jgi:hypothetical protein
MENVKQYLIIWLLFTFLLSGCVANNEMSQVVEHLNKSNKSAQQVILQLNKKDQVMTELVQDRNSQIKQLVTTQVQQLYFENLADLRQAIIKANRDISVLFDNSKQHCLSLVEAEVKSLVGLVSLAEQQAVNIMAESKKFPNDKTLQLQAAKAAADYFGRLNATNSIGTNAKTLCADGLKAEKADAELKIKGFQTSQEEKLAQFLKSKINEISAIKFIDISTSQPHFDALLAWSHENEIAHNNTMMYLNTNNLLSSKGVLASVIKGLGQGAIAVVVGKNVAIPSAADIGNSGKMLVDALSKDTKEAFSSTLLNAKQGLTSIKNNIGMNIHQIALNSVMSVLREKAEK